MLRPQETNMIEVARSGLERKTHLPLQRSEKKNVGKNVSNALARHDFLAPARVKESFFVIFAFEKRPPCVYAQVRREAELHA